MDTYTFSVTLLTTVRVVAVDEATARRMVTDLDGNVANLGAWPDGSPVLATFEHEGELERVEDDEDEVTS